MDWQGQKLAEQIMQIMLLVFAVTAFVAGHVLGSFRMMVLVYAGGVTLTGLITFPNWPFFNRHPLNWLDPSEAEKHPKPQVTVSSKRKASRSKVIQFDLSIVRVFLLLCASMDTIVDLIFLKLF